MAQPILTLTTDFGLDDQYAGAMKGVILGICPDARIVDISHGIAPFRISEGAYVIAQAWRYFPPGTVHVVVVDPGVGTFRRPILLEAGGHFFIGPDNGVLSMVYLREASKVRVISNETLFRHPVSTTFHGRDIFAPVAAHVAAGISPESVGSVIEDYVWADFVSPNRMAEGVWQGHILKIDRFGNIVTNFHVDECGDLAERQFTIRIGGAEVVQVASNYAGAASGELFAILGSSGYYEISLTEDSAAAKVRCGPETPIELRIR